MGIEAGRDERTTGCVYISQYGDEEVFKIGQSSAVDIRHQTFRTANYRLRLIDTIEFPRAYLSVCETWFHHMLRSKRVARTNDTFAGRYSHLEAVIRKGREFLPEFVAAKQEAERCADLETDGRSLPPTDEDRAAYAEYLAAREQEDAWRYRREHLADKLKARIAGSAGLCGLITWETVEQSRLDAHAIEVEQPEIYRRYQRGVRFRRFEEE